jgi:renalase
VSGIVVVGAGMAGLVAARRLTDAGHDVVVLDKGRSPGGRMATRRIGAATFDHGAQFFTVRSDEFAGMVDAWRRDGVVDEWCRGFAGRTDGFPRYKAVGGMNALAKHLARGLDVRCNTMVFRVQPDEDGWMVQDDTGHRLYCDAVIVTTPVPQAVSLCIDRREAIPQALWQTTYEPTLALLAVLDGPSAVPPPGAVQDPDETFSFVADNFAKGISAVPALTLHARGDWSLRHWDHDRDEVAAALVAAARPWCGTAGIVEYQVKRWRYATPTAPWPHRCCLLEADAPLVLAGDAYGGPKVEGAVLSGLAAVDVLS